MTALETAIASTRETIRTCELGLATVAYDDDKRAIVATILADARIRLANLLSLSAEVPA